MSVKSKILAAAASVTLLGGLGAAGALTANAATPSCGGGCPDIFSHEFGKHPDPAFVLDVLRQGNKVGQPLILFRTSDTDPAEDFTAAFQGTVGDFYSAGLVSAAVDLHYGGACEMTAVTTPVLAAPAIPAVTQSTTLGTVLAGTYGVEVTYVNASGETVASLPASVTTTGTTSRIIIHRPAAIAGADGWNAYVTQAGGSTYTLQDASPLALGANLTITAPPTSTGVHPPATNTATTGGAPTSACTAYYVNDPAFEIEYAPYGVDSGLCMGTGSTAGAGTKVALEGCGTSSETVWIADTADSPSTLANGYVPLINGSDTNFSQPFVLTYPANGYPTDTPRVQLETENLSGFSGGTPPGPELGTVDDTQLWGADFGTLK